MDEALAKAARVAAQKARSRGISCDGTGGYARHLLLCVGAGCCEGGDHRATVRAINNRIQALKKEGTFVYLTLAQCLSFCRGGPLLVVYPDGTWYHSVTPAAVDRIFAEHIRGGRVVADHAFAHNPMRPAP